MITKKVVIGVALGLIMAVTVGRVATAETEHGTFKTRYGGTISGTATSMSIDAINPGDGVKGIQGTFTFKTHNLGQVTAQVLVEDIPALVPSGTCPAGTDTELTLGSIHAVHRFQNGDLLYLNALTRTACFNIDTLTVVAHQSGEITGGTGQFAQATGSWEIADNVNVLVIDPAGQLFAAFTGEFSGTIITPTPVRMGD
jgi:hypothetical protein